MVLLSGCLVIALYGDCSLGDINDANSICFLPNSQKEASIVEILLSNFQKLKSNNN